MSAKQAGALLLQKAGPVKAKIACKLEDFGTWAGGKTGMPAELIRSETDKQQIIQAGGQAAQAGMATSQAPVQ